MIRIEKTFKITSVNVKWTKKIKQEERRKHMKKMVSNNSTQIGYGGSILVGWFLLLVIRSWQNNY